jgi:hypothetical protein
MPNLRNISLECDFFLRVIIGSGDLWKKVEDYGRFCDKLY